ncbi:uncharacterized protein fs(2)ltoPP43 isoform X2 [Eurosta solidaginis]|uniref:uncharacterized protein fs(2)ltoPP43 isoform X2 n=1 Tax=Eurosta solidaginis TaxID=178769 RepID=UPI003530B240
MPAVVRIKRRIDEEPLSAFILNSKKRRRLDDLESVDPVEGAAGIDVGAGGDGGVTEKDDEVSTILKFAGTIQEQDNSATTQLARLTKEAAKELVQQKSIRQPTNHTERARQEMRQALHENRFRVVNCMRTTLDDTDAEETVKEVTIVDIEKQDGGGLAPTNQTNVSTQNATESQHSADTTYEEAQFQNQQTTDSDTGYVYDLYLPENEWQIESGDMMDDNYLRLHYPFNYYHNNNCYNYFYW